jgi:hypothetical protein
VNPGLEDRSGDSVFVKDDGGQIFHTYSTYGRGGEEFLGIYRYLDVTPKGRNEDGPFKTLADWVRPKNMYGKGGTVESSGRYHQAACGCAAHQPAADMPANETVSLTVTATAPSDAEQAIAAMVLAFSADPAARWTFADPRQYLTHFPAIVRAFGGKAFAHGTGYHVSGFGGAALWLPPGIQPDEEALAAGMRAGVAPERQAAVLTPRPPSRAWSRATA